MARPRKIKSPKELEAKWEEFKVECDNKTVICHKFSARLSDFVTRELVKPVTYTIEGFCIFIGILRQDFYDSYANNKKFYDIVTRIREECELDARRKFEQGTIPTQLSGLWMSKYGYSIKQESTVENTHELSDGFIEALSGTAADDWSEEDAEADNSDISV